MRRRTLLASVASGTMVLAGCTSAIGSKNTANRVYNPTGLAKIRPIDEPLIQHGLTSESEQYLSARLFLPGDTLAVTAVPGASEYAETVQELSEHQFAVMTELRTAAAVPAYFWPFEAQWSEERVRIDVERVQKDPVSGVDEVVGVALTAFEVDDEPPAGVDVVFPGGAKIAAGTGK